MARTATVGYHPRRDPAMKAMHSSRQRRRAAAHPGAGRRSRTRIASPGRKLEAAGRNGASAFDL